MTELARLFNAAGSPKFDAAAAGTEPPVNKLDGLDNPFNKIIFNNVIAEFR